MVSSSGSAWIPSAWFAQKLPGSGGGPTVVVVVVVSSGGRVGVSGCPIVVVVVTGGGVVTSPPVHVMGSRMNIFNNIVRELYLRLIMLDNPLLYKMFQKYSLGMLFLIGRKKLCQQGSKPAMLASINFIYFIY